MDLRPPLVAGRIRKSTGESDRARAVLFARGAIEAARKTPTASDRWTIADAIASLIEERRAEGGRSLEYQRHLESHLRALGRFYGPESAAARLGEVERHEAARFDALSAKLAPSTVNWRMCALRALIRHARHRGAITVLPDQMPRAASKDTLDQRAERFKTRTPAEIEAIGRLLPAHYAPLWVFLAASGARPSQALSLLPSDVDFEAGAVFFRAIAQGNKGKRRYRVRLHPLALDALRRASEYQAGHRVTQGAVVCTRRPGVTRAGRVFPFAIATVQEAVRSAAKRAGFPGATLYELRHTFATRARAAGASMEGLRQQLGHSRQDVTEIYARRAALEAADVIEATEPPAAPWAPLRLG